MAAVYPTYPVTTLAQAEDMLIFTGNQIHDIMNADATSVIETEDGQIPSIRKALVDNIYFKTPQDWVASTQVTDPLQLKQFTDGGWYFAPTATASAPVTLGTTPIGDTNWKPWNKDQVAVYQHAKRLAAEAGYNMVSGSFHFGGTLNSTDDVLFYEGDGKYYSWSGAFPKVVAAGSTPATSGGAGAWVDRTDLTLRGELGSFSKCFDSTPALIADNSLTEGDSVFIRTSANAFSDEFFGVVSSTPSDLYIALSSGLFVNIVCSGNTATVDSNQDFNQSATIAAKNNLAVKVNRTVSFSGQGIDVATISGDNTGVVFNGIDREVSRINFTPPVTDSSLFKLKTSVSGVGLYGSAVKNISVIGDSIEKNGIAIDALRAVYSDFKDIFIQHMHTGMIMNQCFGSKLSNVQIWNSDDVNFKLVSSQNNAIAMIACQSYSSGSVGNLHTGNFSVPWYGGTVEGNPTGVKISGLNYSVIYRDSYSENNNYHFDVGGGSVNTVISGHSFRLNGGDVGIKVTNTNTASLLQLTVRDSLLYGSDGGSSSFIDFTAAAGSDSIQILIDEVKTRVLSGSTVNYFTSSGVPYLPPSSYFIKSSIPIRDQAFVFSVGTGTTISNMKLFPVENKLMEMRGELTIASMFTYSGRQTIRLTLDSGVAPTKNQSYSIYAEGVDPSILVEGIITFRADGIINISFPSSVVGSTILLDGIRYTRS